MIDGSEGLKHLNSSIKLRRVQETFSASSILKALEIGSLNDFLSQNVVPLFLQIPLQIQSHLTLELFISLTGQSVSPVSTHL